MSVRKNDLSRLVKFSNPKLQENTAVPFGYPNIWERQDQMSPGRLIVAPAADRVALFIDLMQRLPEPFGILYVLILSRAGQNLIGRYQLSQPQSRADAETFLLRFKDFFECDGRHALWAMSVPTGSQIIYDQHDFFYAYGPLGDYEEVLRQRGFTPGKLEIPVPHTHHYHQEFDAVEDELLAYWEWKHFPLQPGDDP